MKHTAELPHGYKVTFHWHRENRAMVIEWDPDMPASNSFKSRKAANRFLEAYQTERDRFIATVASQIGGTIAVADVAAKNRPAQVRIIKPDPAVG